MGIASGNRHIIEKTEIHPAGEALSAGDIVELYGNELFKITARPKFIKGGAHFEIDSGYYEYNRTVSVVRPNLLATFSNNNDADPNVQSIFFDDTVLRNLQTGYDFNASTIDGWISMVTLNKNKVLCVWTDSTRLTGYAEVSPLEHITLTVNGSLFPFETVSAICPDVHALSQNKAVVLYQSKTSTSQSILKLCILDIADNMTITSSSTVSILTIIQTAIDLNNAKLLWLGGDQYVGVFKHGAGTKHQIIPITITEDGTVDAGMPEMVNWQDSANTSARHNIIQIGNNRVLFLEAYAYGGSTTDRRVSATVLEADGTTITQLGSTTDVADLIPDTIISNLAVGHISENHILLIYYHNSIDDSFAAVLRVEDDYTVTVVSDTKFDLNIVYAINNHICRIDQNLFGYTWTGADNDTWVQIHRIDDASQDNILGVVKASASEGDDCEVVTQGKMRLEALTEGEKGYCSSKGDIVNYMPINYESRHGEACFFTPRRVEIGKQKTDTIFEVNIKHQGGQSGIS